MKPFWKWIPVKWAHKLAPLGVCAYSQYRNCFPVEEGLQWRSFSWKGLSFRNPIGIAGGLDKNAQYLNQWENLGFAFTEVGTITPQPQRSNPGRILGRDWPNKNLWNKMGFPNQGADRIYKRLSQEAHKNRDRLQLQKQTKFSSPLFINIGKNRNTANEKAWEDYLFLTDKFKELADALVINISSPNTQGLRDLQEKDSLAFLSEKIVNRAGVEKPVLLKLSPDQNEESLNNSLKVGIETGISGFILTNTTSFRPSSCSFPSEGGLSGKDLKPLSIRALKQAVNFLGSKKENYLLISAGGILSSEDIKERLLVGANLVQIYSALVFQGPSFVHKVLKELTGDRTLPTKTS